MNPLRIAVGSKNPVKVAAVTTIVQRIWPDATVLSAAVDSGVRAQPRGDEEAIQGAITRARRARCVCAADLGVGLEGSTVENRYGMFNTGWAAIVDREQTVGIGGSGKFRLPAQVAAAVRAGHELGPLMDQLCGEQNTRQRQGAFGIFTNDLISRQDALETALIAALTRFLNPHYYEPDYRPDYNSDDKSDDEPACEPAEKPLALSDQSADAK